MALIEAELVVQPPADREFDGGRERGPILLQLPGCVVRQTRAAMSTRGPIATSSLT